MATRWTPIIIAFVLGVVVSLAVIFAGGGAYEYQIVNGLTATRLVNQQHWEVVTNVGLPEGAYCVRRPRIRLGG